MGIETDLMRALKRVKETVHEAASAGAQAERGRINVADSGQNIVVARNIGPESGNVSASAKQRLSIRQQEGRSQVVSETVSESFEAGGDNPL